VDHAVSNDRDEPLNPGFTPSAHSLRIDYIESLAKLCDHLSDQLRRILKVDIHRDDCVPGRILKTRQRCLRLAKPPRKLKQLNPGVTGPMLQNHLFRSIRGRIHRKYDFKLRRTLLKNWNSPSYKFWDIFFFPVNGNDDGNVHNDLFQPLTLTSLQTKSDSIVFAMMRCTNETGVIAVIGSGPSGANAALTLLE